MGKLYVMNYISNLKKLIAILTGTAKSTQNNLEKTDIFTNLSFLKDCTLALFIHSYCLFIHTVSLYLKT